jgi:hypothetical protein
MLFGKKLICILSIIIILALLTGTTLAKSVYAIIDRYSTVAAYDIQGDQIAGPDATAQNLPHYGGGAVGLALDPDSEILFVTYEASNIIEMVNAKTMVSEQNPITVPGASNLSGITFDQTKQKLYVMEREDNRLYVYLWSPFTHTLILEGDTYKILENIGTYPYGAYGIALDESSERLYVTDATNTVKYYETTNWDYKGSINIVVNSNPRKAVGIDIDPNRCYLYTGSFTGQSGDHTFLVRTDITDINNPLFTEHNVGAYVIGVAADEDTGLVYVTTKHEDIEVYNTSTFPSDPCYIYSNDIFQPADIVLAGDVSYKPPLFYLEKVNVNEPNCVILDDYITYRITYGPNGVDHNNVVLTDFLPLDVHFVSADNNGVYDSNLHTVTWRNIGHLDANDPCDSVTLTVKVNDCILGCGTITNYCEAESDSTYNTAEASTPVCSASNPNPTCGAIVDLDTGEFNLTWCPGHFAADSNGHEVYFGSNFNDVNDANNLWPIGGVYKGPNTNPSYPIQFSDLDVDTTYYWRIDEVNTAHPDKIWPGAVWEFTTGNYFVVENFNSYADDDALRAVWKDGMHGGVLAEISLQIGNADANLVHDGNSMMYYYNNYSSPFYSEAYANTAALPSQIGSNWTVGGVKALSLYFYGQADNDADEQMYVKLTDGDNPAHSKTVIYDGDMNDIRKEQWQEWNIALTEFTDVNLANVARITIGFGDGNDPYPAPNPAGTVYFDDIRLYLERCLPGYYPAGDFDSDCDVDFYDFAIFGLAWLTDDPNISLDDDNDVDIDDLAIFCDHWLWQEGGGTSMSSGFSELLYAPPPPQQSQIELQPEPEPQLQVQSEPELLQPEPQPQPQYEPYHTTQELIDWLEGVLADEEIKNTPTEDSVRKMIESLKEQL